MNLPRTEREEIADDHAHAESRVVLPGVTLGLVLARDFTYQISMDYVPNFRAIPHYR